MIYEHGHRSPLFHILLKGHIATHHFYKKPQVLAVVFSLLKRVSESPKHRANNPAAKQHPDPLHPLSNLLAYEGV